MKIELHWLVLGFYRSLNRICILHLETVRLPHSPFAVVMKGSSEVLSILHNVTGAYYRDANRIPAVDAVVEPYGRHWRYDDAYVERKDVVDRHLYLDDAFWDPVVKVDQIHHWHVYALERVVLPDRSTVLMMISAFLG
jgi:hypothetical protein